MKILVTKKHGFFPDCHLPLFRIICNIEKYGLKVLKGQRDTLSPLSEIFLTANPFVKEYVKLSNVISILNALTLWLVTVVKLYEVQEVL